MMIRASSVLTFVRVIEKQLCDVMDASFAICIVPQCNAQECSIVLWSLHILVMQHF